MPAQAQVLEPGLVPVLETVQVSALAQELARAWVRGLAQVPVPGPARAQALVREPVPASVPEWGSASARGPELVLELAQERALEPCRATRTAFIARC